MWWMKPFVELYDVAAGQMPDAFALQLLIEAGVHYL